MPTWKKVGVGAGAAAALLATWSLAGKPADKTGEDPSNVPDANGEILPEDIRAARETVHLRVGIGNKKSVSVKGEFEKAEKTRLTPEQKEALRISMAPLMGEMMDTVGLSESTNSKIASRIMDTLREASFTTNQSETEAMLSRFNVVDEKEEKHGRRLITIRINSRYERTEDGTDAYPVRTASISRVIGEESYDLEAEDDEDLEAMVIEQIRGMTNQ